MSLTLLAPGATLIFKIFLSPLDPKAAMLKSQLELFFPHLNGTASGDGFAEFDAEEQVGGTSKRIRLREGGVWVRKPRSSRPGSGGESGRDG